MALGKIKYIIYVSNQISIRDQIDLGIYTKIFYFLFIFAQFACVKFSCVIYLLFIFSIKWNGYYWNIVQTIMQCYRLIFQYPSFTRNGNWHLLQIHPQALVNWLVESLPFWEKRWWIFNYLLHDLKPIKKMILFPY